MQKVNFWKFVSHEVATSQADAAALAIKIERGEFIPCNQSGERYYRLGGWCYDVGRKPFLVEYFHGGFERKWAKSVKELRIACYLKRVDRVIADPFWREEKMEVAA
jgi:hypothetical protein